MLLDPNGNVVIEPEVAFAIKKFLHYSLEPVDYEYQDLTPQEKQLCDEEDFLKLVSWLKAS